MMADIKTGPLEILRRNVTELEATANALRDASSEDGPMETVIDDLLNLAGSMRRQLKILEDNQTQKLGENTK